MGVDSGSDGSSEDGVLSVLVSQPSSRGPDSPQGSGPLGRGWEGHPRGCPVTRTRDQPSSFTR